MIVGLGDLWIGVIAIVADTGSLVSGQVEFHLTIVGGCLEFLC